MTTRRKFCTITGVISPRKLWRRLKGITPTELDPKKVDVILKQLNSGKVEGDWIVAADYHALMSVNPDGRDGKPEFNPSKGVLVKVFLNRKTGEIRPYFLRSLEKGDG